MREKVVEQTEPYYPQQIFKANHNICNEREDETNKQFSYNIYCFISNVLQKDIKYKSESATGR